MASFLRIFASSLTGLLLLLCSVQAQEVLPTEQGLPGRRAGSQRWIVHFKSRGFDLEALRQVIANRSQVQVNASVGDLDLRMRQDQEAFFTQVERDYAADVVQQWWIVNACAIEVMPEHLPAISKLERVLRLEPDRALPALIKLSTNAANHNADHVQQTLGVCPTGQL